MTDINIKVNDAYLPYLNDMSDVLILYGGSGSGKSKFMSQRVVIDVLGGGRNYLILRQVARTIRRSVFNEIVKAISESGLSAHFKVNKSEALITCSNGYQIMFAGLDDVEKIKSITPQLGVLTDAWIEEATETNRDSFKNLLKRLRGGDESVAKRIVMTFNPIIKLHWIYQEFFATIGWRDDQTEYHSKELSILKTWYVHNAFLTKQDVENLLDEKDAYYRNVYTFGNWGILGAVIFKNWIVRDLSHMHEQFTNTKYGLDFGFSKDPAALVVAHYDRLRKTIYIYDELYERELTNQYLAYKVVNIVSKNAPVICDSSEPKSIAELRQHRVNALKASKGKDSVVHGIQWLQGMQIVVDSKCVNMQTELSMYKWREDSAGNVLPEPVDSHNHLIDALRYAMERDAQGGAEISVSATILNYIRSTGEDAVL